MIVLYLKQMCSLCTLRCRAEWVAQRTTEDMLMLLYLYNWLKKKKALKNEKCTVKVVVLILYWGGACLKISKADFGPLGSLEQRNVGWKWMCNAFCTFNVALQCHHVPLNLSLNPSCSRGISTANLMIFWLDMTTYKTPLQAFFK